FIRRQINIRPKIAIILGSGLGEFAESISKPIIIKTNTIPHYPCSTVEGHKGNLIFGRLKKVSTLIFQGRVHFYETGDINTVLYPIRVAASLGIKTMLITNAAGGINRSFKPGDLMLIKDQINLTFENSLTNTRRHSIHEPLYDSSLQEIIRNVAHIKQIHLKEGIYCGIKGPSYETAAEVEMIQRMGADAVGMSTVNEVTLATALGIRVASISCITNLSTGILNQKLTHEEVTDVASMVRQTFSELVSGSMEKFC
ncbi:MAG: purine-nucleoside phosphorylase, partial [Ignavibacteriales bacterium]|nr:purine-nucleoside phosphorylase [Ignavibacteriales bacterium]